MHTDNSWSAARRFGFQLIFCYWAFDTSPFTGGATPLDLVPWVGSHVSDRLFWPMEHLSVWVGQYVFHLTGIAASWHPTGSGDTALAWIVALCNAIFALVAAVAWHLLDRKRDNYRTLSAWLGLWLSLVLGLTMLIYGFGKIFPVQFQSVNVAALNETYGESTPMHLLWTFMGASAGYTFFAGLGEVVGGFLLLFRRTRTAGALLCGAILFNIFLLNMFYDVPVKLYSFHLMLMVVTLLWSDLRALFGLLFRREQVQLRTDGVPAPERRFLRVAAYCARGVVAVTIAWSIVYQNWAMREKPEPRSSLFGAWRVEHASSTFRTAPWQQVYISGGKQLYVATSDGNKITLPMQDDTYKRVFTVTDGPWGPGKLHYAISGNPRITNLVLDGTLKQGTIHAELLRTSPDTYLLETQGFHWIHEMPPNR